MRVRRREFLQRHFTPLLERLEDRSLLTAIVSVTITSPSVNEGGIATFTIQASGTCARQ